MSWIVKTKQKRSHKDKQLMLLQEYGIYALFVAFKKTVKLEKCIPFCEINKLIPNMYSCIYVNVYK